MATKDKEILKFTNEGIMAYVCAECGHSQDNNKECAKCGAPSRRMDAQPVILPDKERVNVETLGNLIFGTKHVNKGSIVSLSTSDPKLEDLKKRKLIKVVSGK